MNLLQSRLGRAFLGILLIVFLLFAYYFFVSDFLYYFYRYFSLVPSQLFASIFALLEGNTLIQQNMVVFYTQLLLLGFAVLCGLFFFVARFSKPAAGQESDTTHEWTSWTLILAVGLSLALAARRYLILAHPAGFDAPIYVAEFIQLHSSGLTPYTYGFMQLSGLFYPLVMLGFSPETVVDVVPVVLICLAAIATYLLGENFGRNTGILAAFLVPLSLTVLRQGSDLYTGLLTYSLLLLFFYAYLKFLDSANWFALIFCLVVLPYMTLYGIGWVGSVATVLVFMFTFSFTEKNIRTVKRTILVFSSSFAVIVAGLFYDTYAVTRLITQGLSGYVNLNPNTAVSNLETLTRAPSEQTVMVVLSILGLLFIARRSRGTPEREKRASGLILSYCVVLAISLLVTQTYRIVLYFPFPLLSVLGIRWVEGNQFIQRINFPKLRFPGFTISWKKAAALLLLSLVVANALYYEDNVSEVTGFPPSGVADAISWINQDSPGGAVVIVNQYNYQTNWLVALVPPIIYRGDTLYVGSVTSFVSGTPSSLIGYPLSSPSFFNSFFQEYKQGKLGVFTIDGFYYVPNATEMQFLQPVHQVAGYTVYQLRVFNITSLS